MTVTDIITYCIETFDDLILITTWGEQSLFYNPQNKYKRGVYVLTIKEKDRKNDNSSFLDREGVFRINIGIKNQLLKKYLTLYQKDQKPLMW